MLVLVKIGQVYLHSGQEHDVVDGDIGDLALGGDGGGFPDVSSNFSIKFRAEKGNFSIGF